MLRIPTSLISTTNGTPPAQIDAIRSGNAVFLATQPAAYHPTLGIRKLATELDGLDGLITRTQFGSDVFVLLPDGPYHLDTSRLTSLPRDALRFTAQINRGGGLGEATTEVLVLPGFEFRTSSLKNLSLTNATRRGLYGFTAFLNEQAGCEFTVDGVNEAIENLLDKGMRQGRNGLVYELSDFRKTETDIRATIAVPKGGFTRTIYLLKPDPKNPEFEWSFTPFRWRTKP